MNSQMTLYAILFAIACMLIAALIPTAAWASCHAHAGGVACRPLQGEAVGEWRAVAVSLLALVYQKDPPRRS